MTTGQILDPPLALTSRPLTLVFASLLCLCRPLSPPAAAPDSVSARIAQTCPRYCLKWISKLEAAHPSRIIGDRATCVLQVDDLRLFERKRKEENLRFCSFQVIYGGIEIGKSLRCKMKRCNLKENQLLNIITKRAQNSVFKIARLVENFILNEKFCLKILGNYQNRYKKSNLLTARINLQQPLISSSTKKSYHLRN